MYNYLVYVKGTKMNVFLHKYFKGLTLMNFITIKDNFGKT